MNNILIHVHYPPGKGRLTVRTEADWERDIEGEPVADGAVFQVQTEQPWIYFKPCLHLDGEVRWVPGINRLAEPSPGGRHIYPFFLSETRGALQEPEEIDGLRFRVYLPAGYDENTLSRYPVVYMHDGANLFLPEEAFSGEEWRVDECLDTLDDLNVIDQAIVVGIYPGDRMVTYTHPGYIEFARRCAQVLLPAVDARYRTLTGPRKTVVMGSSLGGVVALHMAWTWPDVFGGAGCLSPTFGVMDDLFERIRTEPLRDLRVYLDSGWPNDNFDRTVAMRDLLLQRGMVLHSRLLHLVFPGAGHNEGSWASRLHIPFQWFFARAPNVA